jgi:hypothetical protein
MRPFSFMEEQMRAIAFLVCLALCGCAEFSRIGIKFEEVPPKDARR